MLRKQFVASATLAIPAAALGSQIGAADAQSSPPAIRFRILRPGEYDHAAMLRTLATPKSHKQVFQSVTPLVVADTASLYLHMQNSLNAYEFSFGMGRGSLAVLGILTGASIAYALSDAMWSKYGVGAAFHLAATNVYHTAKSLSENGRPDDPGSIYQDWSAQAVLRRGGSFMVCHNAMTGIANLLAAKAGMKTDDVLEDFMRNLLPGFHMVPAGVGATQLALEHGWHLYPVI